MVWNWPLCCIVGLEYDIWGFYKIKITLPWTVDGLKCVYFARYLHSDVCSTELSKTLRITVKYVIVCCKRSVFYTNTLRFSLHFLPVMLLYAPASSVKFFSHLCINQINQRGNWWGFNSVLIFPFVLLSLLCSPSTAIARNRKMTIILEKGRVLYVLFNIWLI